MTYATLLLEHPAEGVALLRIHRPEARNALNRQVIADLIAATETLDADESIGCIVLTGDDTAFAAGADIKAFAAMAVHELMRDDFTDWGRLMRVQTPVIAAVSGWALGGGCELAMLCDLIIASETAVFGQPEIGIGIMPGAGGTQRLTRAVGKAIALEVMLGARRLSAQEAAAFRLVNRVAPVDSYLSEAIALAATIAAQPRTAVRLIKDAVNAAAEVGLSAGLAHEKRNFLITFATHDKQEGMTAFIEKRRPRWSHR